MTDTLLVVPARNEAASMPRVAALARKATEAGVISRTVVVVNGSTDGTLAAAQDEGLDAFVPVTDRLPLPVLGKGDALWRALVLRPAERYLFMDADVEGIDVTAMQAMVSALDDPGVVLAKGAFDRLQQGDGTVRPLGGRVTELLTKPVLSALVPELGHVREPLSGQAAIDGPTARSLPIVTGFGVEIGMLISVFQRHGPQAIRSVDIGQLTHREKQDTSLVPMAHEVATSLLASLGHISGRPGGDLMDRALPMGLVVRPPAGEVTT